VFPLENMLPYYRGAMYSLVGLRLRHGDLPPAVAADIQRRIEMLQRYSDAATATYRLHRQREQGGG
jgi:hypothetical protein